MSKPIHVLPGITVPAPAVIVRATRSRGPGGQNVNKVSSRAVLLVDISRIQGLEPAARHRLRASCKGSSFDSEGWLRVTSERTRDFRRNLDDATEKLRATIVRALAVPKPRIARTPNPASIVRRIEEKRRRAALKAARAWRIGAAEGVGH